MEAVEVQTSATSLVCALAKERRQPAGQVESPAIVAPMHGYEPTYDQFSRAIRDHDEDCWRTLYERYQTVIIGWCRLAGAPFDADFDALVNQTWAQFWFYYTPAKLAASGGLHSVLCYVRMCAASVVIDEVREHARTISLEAARIDVVDAAAPAPDLVAEQANGRELQHLVQRQLHTEQERVLVHLRYELGYTPTQVHRLRPDLFPSIKDVYRVNRTVLDRLRRCRELRWWRTLD